MSEARFPSKARVSYAEKLKDPRWQKKRLEVLQRDDWTCLCCGATDRTLHVHHVVYLPKRDPWEYAECFLQTLCEDCHAEMSGPEGYDYQGDVELLIRTAIETGEGPSEIHGWAEAIHSAWAATQCPDGQRLADGVHQIVATDAIQRALRDDVFVRYIVERYRNDRIRE